MIATWIWAMTAGRPARIAATMPADGCQGRDRRIAGLIPVPYDFDYAGLVNAPYGRAAGRDPCRQCESAALSRFCAHNEEAKAFLTHQFPPAVTR